MAHLSITRHPNFNYQPGDYVFIQIPSITRYEWHPFTISSAPEMNNVFWLHVRGVGSWTNELYEHFNNTLNDEYTPSCTSPTGPLTTPLTPTSPPTSPTATTSGTTSGTGTTVHVGKDCISATVLYNVEWVEGVLGTLKFLCPSLEN